MRLCNSGVSKFLFDFSFFALSSYVNLSVAPLPALSPVRAYSVILSRREGGRGLIEVVFFQFFAASFAARLSYSFGMKMNR